MLVEFTAYSGDCRVRGTLAVPDGERLSDFVNRETELEITGALLESHADGHTVSQERLTLSREDVLAIEARELRGEAARRVHTVRHRLEFRVGPYAILGLLHSKPGGQPLAAIGRRPAMVPLTGATIAWNDSHGLQLRDVGTLIVNRELVDRVRAEAGDRPVFEGLPEAASS